MLIDISTASPPYKVTQQKAASELKKRMAGTNAVGRLIDMAAAHSGINERFIVIPDAEESSDEKFFSSGSGYFSPDTKMRMDKYEHWSKELAKNAVKGLMEKTQFKAGDLNKLITISCTGFFAPGLDYYLINEFNFPLNIKRTNIGFMGCAASIIGFNNALEYLKSEKESNTIVVSLELCSIHLQTEPTRDNILANMIFADGCAAALFSNSDKYESDSKLIPVFTKSLLFEKSEKYMGWKIGNFGFEMMLSSELPKIILNEAVPSLIKILEKEDIDYKKIKYWALHPGGRAILDSLQNGLNLSDEQMSASREVLKNYGNMSSVSILFVLKELIDNHNMESGEICCAAAFGPGLTMEVAIFKVV